MPLRLSMLNRPAYRDPDPYTTLDRRGCRSPLRQLRGLANWIGISLLVTAVMLADPSPAANAGTPDTPDEYRLRLHHTHTGESIDIVYRRGDVYLPDAVAQLEHCLRDHRTGAVHRFDARLFDLLADLTASVGRPDAVIEVICGYRTPWSNGFLRSKSRGVAGHSLHLQALAIDIRIPGVKTSELRDAAWALQRGGVGYYARSDFVHVDVGRVRRW